MRDARCGCVAPGSRTTPAPNALLVPRNRLREPGLQRGGSERGGLQGEGRSRIVPRQQPVRCHCARSAPSSGHEPTRVVSPIPHPASRIPCDLSQRLVHVRAALPPPLPAPAPRWWRRRVGRTRPRPPAGKRPDGARRQAGSAPCSPSRRSRSAWRRSTQRRVRRRAGGRAGERWSTRRAPPGRCRRAHGLEDVQRRAPGGGGVANPASLRARWTARPPPPRHAAREVCGPPASTASRIACAMPTGSRAAASAVFIRMPSTLAPLSRTHRRGADAGVPTTGR